MIYGGIKRHPHIHISKCAHTEYRRHLIREVLGCIIEFDHDYRFLQGIHFPLEKINMISSGKINSHFKEEN